MVLTLVAGACGGDDETEASGVLTLDESTEAAGDNSGRQSVEDAVLDFTACLREEGIDVPDIQLDADGAPILDPEVIQGIDLQSPEFLGAVAGCISILSDAGAFSFSADPELEALQADQLQAFSECMRREGIDDFPDPDTDAAIPFPITAFTRFNATPFQDALTVCRAEISVDGLDG